VARIAVPKRLKHPPMPDSVGRLTETELEEIEVIARENAAETYRGVLLALVDEVRRLRATILNGARVGR